MSGVQTFGLRSTHFVIVLFPAIFILLLPRPAQVSSPTPSPDDQVLIKADALVRQGEYPTAENIVREYLLTSATSPEAHFKLGFVLFLQKKAKESLAEYTEGAKYRTPNARDLKIVASDYVVLGDYMDADKWFTKVAEWTPNDAEAWYDLGRTKYNENRFDEAIAAFKHVLQLDPTSVKAQDNLGLSYEGGGHNDEAIAAYQLAISMEEKNAERNSGPYLDMGSLLVESNRVEEALPLLNKALMIAPQDFRIRRERGKAYLHLNELDKAAAELEKAIDLAPKNAPLHIMLAQVYRKQGFADKAKIESDRYSALK